MKHLFTKMMVIVAMLFAGNALMTSCTPDQGDDYNGPPVLELGKPDVISAIKVNVPLNAKKLASVGYLLKEKVNGEEPTAPVNATMLFRNGKEIKGCPKVLNLSGDDGLDRGKTFVLFVAATISATEFYNEGEILSVEFTTPDNWADEDVVVKSRNSEGAEIEVIVPDYIKQQNRRIKWGIANFAMLEYYGQAPVPEKLHCNDFVYPASLIKNDTVLHINHANAFRRNADGEVGYYYFAGYNADGTLVIKECEPTDPMVETGEAAPVQYYQHFQPGEPLVLMMSEVDYADCPYVLNLEGEAYTDHVTNGECTHKHPMIDWGWGPGWYWYPYDYQAYLKEAGGDREEGELPMPGVGGGSNSNIDYEKFWHADAWHKRIEIRLPGPEEFTTGDVRINTSGLKTDGGKITFVPTGDTYAYFVCICPETSSVGAGYTDLLKFVNNEPALLQWLTTSEIAPYLSIYPYEGTTVMNLEEVLYDIVAGMRYHVIVNAVPAKMVNGDLTYDVSKQKFHHETFKLPEYTLPEPELIVTPVESYSPYKVKFNIKNANPSQPLKKAAYAFNYSRDFASYMKVYGYTYSDIVLANDGIVDQYGNYPYNFVGGALAEINSEFGYDVEFDVRENSYSTIAVMGWNSEGRPSDPDKEGSKAVAEAKSASMPAADALDMSKLNALKGDWTASATIKTYDYNTGKATTAQKSWKVTIGDLKTDNTLSEADYKIFENAGVEKDAADVYLAEFNQQSADYNAAVLGQNRVLCQGWDISGKRETSTASPWDLFLMTDYNATIVDYLFYDFGPKWFLQTDAEGNIFVPVNYNVVPPMMLWYSGMEHYLCSGNYEKGIANYIKSTQPEDAMDVQGVGIPVEISADGNTITLKSVVVNTAINGGAPEDVTLYPTMIYNNQGSLAFYNPFVISEVVLTKGYTAPKTSSVVAGKTGFGKAVANGAAFKAPSNRHSRTVFAPTTKKASEKEVTVVTKKVLSKEEIRQGMDKYMQRFNFGAARK